MTSTEISAFLRELDAWRDQKPHEWPNGIPRQEPHITEENYLRAVVLVVRPTLMRSPADPELVSICAKTAVEACEKARALSISEETQHSITAMYEAFYHGITVLQCLLVQPGVIGAKDIRRATTSCSGVLSVYVRAYPAAGPFLQLFEKLCDEVLDNLSDLNRAVSTRLRGVLQEVMAEAPSHVPRLYRSLYNDGAYGGNAELSQEEETAMPVRHHRLLDATTC